MATEGSSQTDAEMDYSISCIFFKQMSWAYNNNICVNRLIELSAQMKIMQNYFIMCEKLREDDN